MKRHFFWMVAAGSMALLGTPGCGESHKGPPVAIRLIDRLAAPPSGPDVPDVKVLSHFDLADPTALPRRPESVLLASAFAAGLGPHEGVLPAAAMAAFAGAAPEGERHVPRAEPRFVAGEEGARLVLGAAEAYAGLAAAEPDTTYEASLLIEAGDGQLAGLFVAVAELDRAPAPDLLERPDTLRAAFSGAGSRMHVLAPRGRQGDALRFALGFHTNMLKTRGLLLAVVPRQGEVRIGDVTLLLPDPFREQLLRRRAEFTHAHAARVQIGRDFREAVVAAVPCAVEFEVTLPERAPRITLAAAAIDPAFRDRLDVGIRVARGGRESFESWSPLEPGAESFGWSEIEVTHERFAGERVRITLLGRPRGDAGDAAVGAGIAFGSPVVAEEAAEPDALPPDVVLVSLDTMRADRMSLYGAPVATTPFLDELAESCMVFEQAIAPAAYTLPSHASILTGQLPDRIGAGRPVTGVHPRRAPLLAKEFRAAGYETIAFTGGGYVHPEFGFDAGFERFVTVDPGMVLRAEEAFDAPSRHAVDELLALLDGSGGARRRPRFIFLHTFAAHNYRAPEADLLAVGADPEQAAELARTNLESRPVLDLLNQLGGIRAENRQRLTWLYDGAQRVADNFLRRVVAALETSGGLDRTWLFVFSDHGEELFEHGGFGHSHQVYEELIRVPLLARGPGIRAGRSSAVVSLADLAPTVRELAGLPEPAAGIDGRSLAPLLRGGTLAAQPAIAVATPSSQTVLHAWRGAERKLIRQLAPDRTQLFDLGADPAEANDLSQAEAAEQRRLLERLEARVSALRAAGGEAGGMPDLPPELLRELEQLGYLMPAGPGAPRGPRGP